MTRFLFSVATAGAGLFLAAAAVVAARSGAATPAIVFATLAIGHAVAIGPTPRSALVRAVRVVLGLVELAAIGFAAWFIVGIETAEGFDLSAAWFAPLNGYATVAVGTALAIVAAALLAAGVRGPARPVDVAAGA